MCGISAILRKSAVDIKDIQKMNDIISHRGPDDDGFFLEKNLALGHRRLSIIDLSEAGHQPMSFGDRYQIVFNGEIYNYIEIRDELKTYGINFTTLTDTEVILAAYSYWGKDCVNRFNGMWSFIIYDSKTEHMFCSRDRFGIKPFYYKITPESIYMASEIKQILLLDHKSIANMKILSDFLVYGYSEHTDETFFDGIHNLLPGHCLSINTKTLKYNIYKFYSIEKRNDMQNRSEEDLYNEFSQLMQESVDLRLRSDVPVGGCLSGGLDSSSIIAFASKSHKNFRAYTARSGSSRSDESYYANLVSKHLQAEHTWVTPAEDDFVNQMPHLAYIQEEPFLSPSIFMQYELFRAVKKTGVKVLLDGQGGDETLLGYERYYPSALGGLSFISKFIKAKEISANSKLSYFDVIKYYLYFTNKSVRQKIRLNESTKLFSTKIMSFAKSSEVIKQSAASYSDMFSLQNAEISALQLPHLLRYEDKNSMFHSIETRLPFLDYKLVEFNVNLPLKMKINNGWTKYIVRQSVNSLLPHEVVWRKNKLGFEAPEDEWHKSIIQNKKVCRFLFSQPLIREILHIDVINKATMSQFSKKMVWRLLSIAYWADAYNVTSKK